MSGNYEEFRVVGKQMVNYLCDYVKTLNEKQVTPTIEPGYLVPLLADKIPEERDSYESVMEDVEKHLMPGMLHWEHQHFYAYYGSGNAYPSVLADMFGSATGLNGFSWASCPALTELEKIMLDWFAKAMELPTCFLSKESNPLSVGGASIQGSASDAVFAAMCAAKARAIKKLKGENQEIHDSVYLPKLVCYASKNAHSCVEKAAKMNLMKFVAVDVDVNDSMRGETLLRMVERDVALGLYPFMVIATSGTTSQAAFDNLAEIGAVCQKYPSMWFHIDGAYGGNSFILPERRYLMNGIELADSIDVNPNKLLLVTYDCTCLWVKNVLTFSAAFAIDPLYLQHQHESTVVDLRHFGVPLSRRFRALKLYFTFRMFGLKRLQEYVRRVIHVGEHFEKLVLSDKRFEVKNDVLLGLVCFRLLQSDEVNQDFLARMNSSAKIHLTPSMVKGKYVIRLVACQEFCSEEQVEAAWKMIQEFASETLDGGRRPSELSGESTQRYSHTRRVSRELHCRQIQILTDEATPIVVPIDDDATPMLEIAEEATWNDETTQTEESPEKNLQE